MSSDERKIVHSTYKKNVSDIREAGKNLPVGSTEAEAPKDILSNRTIPGYAAADIQVQQMIKECSQLIEAVASVMDKIGKNDNEVDESAVVTLKNGNVSVG